MEWSFDSPNGVVTLRQEGDLALCRAIRTDLRGSIWKAWLLGGSGRVLLGTLIPEGGALRLRRVVPVAQLQRQGVWPPAGAELCQTDTAFPESPDGWQCIDCPARLMKEPLLRNALRNTERALLRQDGEGFTLGFPFDEKSPFPLSPLFCLCRVEQMNGKACLLFSFNRQGCPRLSGGF